MSSLLARCMGVAHEPQLPTSAAALLIERRSRLTRAEARVLVLDYVGYSRDQLSERLKVSTETVRTYWKRIYRKTSCANRAEARQWLEALLQQELGPDGAL